MEGTTDVTEIQATDGQSPFDSIRTVNDDGSECWSARDLMGLMGYSTWQHFQKTLERAMTAAANTLMDVTRNFTGSRKVSAGRGPSQQDYCLSREAAYLVALNGDPNKQEVAAAQRYFVAQTRRAEVALEPQTTVDVRPMLERIEEKATYLALRDLIKATASDYDKSSPATRHFFARVQNELLRSVSGFDASELRRNREILSWKGKNGPTKQDREIGKNYLTRTELSRLESAVKILAHQAHAIYGEDHVPMAAWADLVIRQTEVTRKATVARHRRAIDKK